MNKKINSYVILDFETGGLSPKKNPVTEIGMLSIRGDNLEEVSRMEQLVKPYDDSLEYSEKALQVTGITVSELNKKGVDVKDFVNHICDEFEKANIHNAKNHKPVIVGHNLAFDIGFLQQVFRYAKKDLSKYIAGKEDYYGNFQPFYYDTMYLSRAKWGSEENFQKHTLEKCCEWGEIELIDGHRALNDVIATKELFCRCIIDMRSDSQAEISGEYRFRDKFEF